MAEPLTQEQIEALKQQLKDNLQAILDEVQAELKERDEQQYNKLAGEVHDFEDASVADIYADLNLTLLDHHMQEIREIQAAFKRMKEGLYGICVDCEAPIGYARLTAYPTAERCIQCQEIYEKTHAEPGHPSI